MPLRTSRVRRGRPSSRVRRRPRRGRGEDEDEDETFWRGDGNTDNVLCGWNPTGWMDRDNVSTIIIFIFSEAGSLTKQATGKKASRNFHFSGLGIFAGKG